MRLLFLGLSLISFVFAGCKSDFAQTVARYVDMGYENAEFLVQNPTFVLDGLYVPDLSAVKGKIIKVDTESYRLEKDGFRNYGDTDLRRIETSYYFFDDDGHISDSFFLITYGENFIETRSHSTYRYTKEKYLKETAYTTLRASDCDETTRQEYAVSEMAGKLTLSSIWTDAYYNRQHECQITFEPGKILYGSEGRAYEIIYNGNAMDYRESFGKEKIVRTYKNGVLMQELCYEENGLSSSDYVISDSGGEGLVENRAFGREELKLVSSQYIKRLFNDVGLLVYEELRPALPDAPGWYDFKTVTVLEHPDDIFIRYF